MNDSDVLELLAQQRADNRALFAQQQAAKARVNATRKQQQAGTVLGFDADQGVALVSVDGNAVPAHSLTSGLLDGKTAIVSDSGGSRGWVDGISSS